jgi:Glycosyl transferase family 2
MKIVAIMPVRNEDWILGLSLRVALKWCDSVVVLAHACTDDSLGIIPKVADEHPNRLCVVAHQRGQWDEMNDRQALLEIARCEELSATHIALIDADEVITADLLPHMRRLVEASRDGWMLDLPLYNVRHGDQYHTNGVWGNRWVATAFLDNPQLHWAGDCFHHREPFGVNRWHRAKPVAQGDGGVMHFWGASERRLIAKHALYRMTERIRWPQKTAAEIEFIYDPATNSSSELARRLNVAGPWTFEAIKPEWIEPYADLMKYLHVDGEPWQEAECRRLYQEYGAERFTGLQLFGVV